MTYDGTIVGLILGDVQVRVFKLVSLEGLFKRYELIIVPLQF